MTAAIATAEAANSVNSTTRPFRFASDERSDPTIRCGASAPDCTSAATSRRPRISVKSGGGTNRSVSPGWMLPRSTTVRNTAGSVIASRTAVTCEAA